MTTSTSAEKYVYDGDHVVFDFLGGGSNYSLEHRYLYGPGVDQVLAQETVYSSPISGGPVLWMLTDNLGTVRDLIDNSGQVVTGGHFTYDAFGQLLSGDTTLTRYLYTAREFDATTGLQYNRERWYDPHTGRFLSEDPMVFRAGDSNLYRYVGNDPTNGTDPSGTSWYNPFSWSWGEWWDYFWPHAVDATLEKCEVPVPVGTAIEAMEAAKGGIVIGEVKKAEKAWKDARDKNPMSKETDRAWNKLNEVKNKAAEFFCGEK